MFRTCVGHWCCIRTTNSNYYWYISFHSDLLATVVFSSCIVHMVALSCWFPPQHFVLMPLPLGCIIRLAKLDFDLPVTSNLWTSYHFSLLAWWTLHPWCCIWRKIHEGILHITMLDVVGTSIACLSSRLLELLSVQVGLLKMRLKLHLFVIIFHNTLPHEIHMSILFCRQNFCDAHVYQLNIIKWWVPHDGELFSCLNLIKYDLD